MLDDETLRSDWRPLATTAATPEAWDRLEAWACGAPARLPADVVVLLHDYLANSVRELAVIGLALSNHHASAGEPPPLDVLARLLIGTRRLDPGPLRTRRAAALADRDPVELYHEVAAGLADLDPVSSEYHHCSMLLALVPFTRLVASATRS